MRIDYSPPRRSTTAAPQRSSGNAPFRSVAVVAVTGCLIFSVGFGTGWYFSQQSTKRAFRAAMEQKSLENSPKEEHPPSQPAVPAAVTVAPVQPAPSAAPAAAPSPAPPAGAQKAPAAAGGPPLSFYESLPSGQKNTVLGSGINEKSKPAPSPAPPAAATGANKPAAEQHPAPTAASATSGGWLVQVAAFSSQKEAESLKTKLAARGYSASVVETHLNDKGTWYRVRIGRHMTKEAAADVASRIGGGAKALPDQE